MKSNKSSAALRFRLVAVLVLASYSQLTLAQKGGLTSGQPGGDSIGDIYSDGLNGAKVGTLLFNSIAPYFNMQPLPMPGGDDEAIKKTFQNLGAGQSLSDAWSNAAKSAAGFEDSPKQPTSYAPPAPGRPSPPPPPVSTYSQQPMPTPDQIAPPPDPCQSGPCFKSADPGPDSQPQIQPNTQPAQPANGITPPPSAPMNRAPLQLTSASSAGSVDPQASVAKFADDIDSHATQWAASSPASANIGAQNSSDFKSSLADYFSSGNAADGLESGGADEAYLLQTGSSVPSSLDTLTSGANTNTFPGPAPQSTGSITAADLASIGADNTGSAAAPTTELTTLAQGPEPTKGSKSSHILHTTLTLPEGEAIDLRKIFHTTLTLPEGEAIDLRKMDLHHIDASALLSAFTRAINTEERRLEALAQAERQRQAQAVADQISQAQYDAQLKAAEEYETKQTLADHEALEDLRAARRASRDARRASTWQARQAAAESQAQQLDAAWQAQQQAAAWRSQQQVTQDVPDHGTGSRSSPGCTQYEESGQKQGEAMIAWEKRLNELDRKWDDCMKTKRAQTPLVKPSDNPLSGFGETSSGFKSLTSQPSSSTSTTSK